VPVELLHKTGITIDAGKLTAAIGIDDEIHPWQFGLAENTAHLDFLNIRHNSYFTEKLINKSSMKSSGLH
jgi:hypothetical protein